MKIVNLSGKTGDAVLSSLLNRDLSSYSSYREPVEKIVQNVRENGDRALLSYTAEFDRFKCTSKGLEVTEKEIRSAIRETDPALLSVMKKAIENIRAYHEKQKRNSWFDAEKEGIILGQKVTPLERVGVYVPGGKAAYPSTVLMNIVPAKVAGVKEIIMVSPVRDGKINPVTVAAAHLAGADRIFRIGGAQAVAALAYGTKTIPKVDKIVGPGNVYVAMAKKCVYGYTGIDSIAGPSEITIIADHTADPSFVAADLLSQAEHDEMASAVLITTSRILAGRVSKEVDLFLKKLSRKDIIKKSLDNNGMILIAKDLPQAADFANRIASEHLELITENPFELMSRIRNAGAIFLGPYSSEPLGDYFAGPDHVLPTSGTARFFSPLSVDDFIKKSSVIYYSEDALKRVSADIRKFAKAEGLTAHANSIAVRFNGKKKQRKEK